MAAEFVFDFDQIFNDYVEANQKVWAHDRSQTLGASEVFDCIKKAWFGKRGKEFGFNEDPDYEEDWGAMVRGDLIENHYVVPAVRNHAPPGVKVLFTGDDQVTLVLDRNSATPDGLITGLPKGCALRIKGGAQDIFIPNIKSDCVVLEIKSIDPRAVLMEERAKHNGQTQVQIGLFHENTEHRPYYSIVLYIDASFLSKVTPFVVEYEPEAFAAAKRRSELVWNTEDPTELIPEGRFSGACEHCKYRVACGTSINDSIPSREEDEQSTPETIAEMDRRVKMFLEAKSRKEAAEKDVEETKQHVREMLKSRNTRKMRSEEWSVSWYSQDGRKTVDTKAMRADGIDLEPYEKEGAPFDVVRVTERLQDNSDKPKKPRKKKVKEANNDE